MLLLSGQGIHGLGLGRAYQPSHLQEANSIIVIARQGPICYQYRTAAVPVALCHCGTAPPHGYVHLGAHICCSILDDRMSAAVLCWLLDDAVLGGQMPGDLNLVQGLQGKNVTFLYGGAVGGDPFTPVRDFSSSGC